ncbi:MAG TPA: ABC transporter permease [Thermoanaerobaculia bacterium]|nr:ABC transporter permease [Thermoanaerobaculia bacterium]
MLSFRLALRTLSQTPLVTGIACLSLALGIGATSAIFSLFDQMVLRPLAVEEPDRLVNLSAPGPKPGSQSCSNAGDCDEVFSYPMFRDLENAAPELLSVAAHRDFGANLAYRGQTASAEGLLVSGRYFSTLGLEPALGRLFGPDDNRTPGAHPIVVLGHDYWQNRFGASSSVVGESLTVNGQALTIVGVAPAGFYGTTLGSRPQVFVPIVMRETVVPGFRGLDDRRSYWVYLFGRLARDASRQQAEIALNSKYAALINEVEAPLQEGMSEATMARFRVRTVSLSSGSHGQSSVRGSSRAPLLLLLGATAFVLLIACANVANLLLARSASRAGEIAVRLSLGAGRRQLVAQLLTESGLMALAAGLGGLLAAGWTLELLRSLLPAQTTANLSFQVDLRMLGFTAALALGTGLAFGLFPALHSTRPELASILKGQATRTSGTRAAARFRAVLVTGQISLAMALLVSAGLFTKSLANVSRVDLGLKTDHLVVFAVSPELSGYTPERSKALFERVEEELSGLPGVTTVAGSMVPLIAGSNWGSSVSVEGFEAGPDTDTQASFNEIGPGFFATVGIPLLSGRDFGRTDVVGAPKVAIVNEAFARKFNLGRDAVGKRMAMSRRAAPELDLEIVGLVADAKYSDVKQAVPPQFFTPYRQDEGVGALNFYVRTGLAPEQLVTTIGEVIRRLDPNLPVENLQTMAAQVRDNVFIDRLIGTLSTAFALLATLLAAVGLYGVLAYTVAQRTREIGLRMALGADAQRVRVMVLRQVGWMTVVGAVVGILAALGLARLGRSLLFELEGHDPAVLAGAAVALAIVALAAGAIPAARASKVQPMVALRQE